MAYVSADELAKQISYRDLTNPRLQSVCEAASAALDDWCGKTAPFGDPAPAMIHEIALSLAVDIWKQPDATFGIMGLGESGPVRVARDLVMRYDALLVPYIDPVNGYGIA
jgi:hypothetical protein